MLFHIVELQRSVALAGGVALVGEAVVAAPADVAVASVVLPDDFLHNLPVRPAPGLVRAGSGRNAKWFYIAKIIKIIMVKILIKKFPF